MAAKSPKCYWYTQNRCLLETYLKHDYCEMILITLRQSRQARVDFLRCTQGNPPLCVVDDPLYLEYLENVPVIEDALDQTDAFQRYVNRFVDNHRLQEGAPKDPTKS